jgi:hypothetical protein
VSDERDDEERVRALGELYRRLAPPPLADGLDEADAQTERAVRWMQAAWRGLEVPPSTLPIRRAAAPRKKLRRRALPWLVAAGVLAGGAALLLRGPRVPEPGEQLSAASIEIEDVRTDRIELRSGPVRLVLLSPPKRDQTPSEPDSTGG